MSPDGAAAADAQYERDKRLVASAKPEDRRQVAGRAGTRAELLYFLATDQASDVRRAVASNESTPWQADELLVRDKEVEVRADLGGKLARLLPGMSDAARSEVRGRVLAMLESLAKDEAVRVRAALAEAIKAMDGIPPSLVRELAGDEALAVAEPVLRFSPLLGDDDLLAIIAGRHASGALGVIAGREGIGGAVADAIVRANDDQAVALLLANPSAQVREETLDLIVERAPSRASWHAPLVSRPVLPSRLAARLATFLADALLSRLSARIDLDPGARNAITQAIAAKTAPPEAEAPAAPVEPAEDRVKRLKREGKLDEDVIWSAMEQSDRGFVRAALGELAGASAESVDKIFSGRSAKGLVALCWKADVGPRLAYQLQLRFAGLSPRQALGPKSGGWPLTPDEMTWHLEFFGI
ncbi:MAG: DUF2336 domain-containing protein [Alphaproteobacteria bacterium]|nr:DUF2336 domain-containing protein [Alphaproteobacteria bacterium]